MAAELGTLIAKKFIHETCHVRLEPAMSPLRAIVHVEPPRLLDLPCVSLDTRVLISREDEPERHVGMTVVPTRFRDRQDRPR
jgi:hypothetical protein